MAVVAFAAWLGAALIVVSDGRRALALGLALITTGFAALAWSDQGPLAAAVLIASGAVAAVQRLRIGTKDWLVMPPGSTPRLILAVVAGLLALWVAVSVTTGAGGPLRFGTLAVIFMLGARTLSGSEPEVLLTSIVGMALAVGVGSGLAGSDLGLAPYLAAALVAAGIAFLPAREAHGA